MHSNMQIRFCYIFNLKGSDENMKKFYKLAFTIIVLVLAACGEEVTDSEIITVNGNTKYQTMTGWEFADYVGQDSLEYDYRKYKDLLLKTMVQQTGINRLHLGVRSGVENTNDYYKQFREKKIPYLKWKSNRYATVNDNNDSHSINWDGFNFTELDEKVTQVILPLRALLQKKGEKLYVKLSYVAFVRQIKGGKYHHADSEEYAEFMEAVFLHLRKKFNFTPDALEIMLEPDLAPQWSGRLVGQSIVAVVKRLARHGFHPDIIAPSCTSVKNAVSFFDEMIKVEGVLDSLTEISYHRYQGSIDDIRQIAERARRYNLKTSMLEWWHKGLSPDDLLVDLKTGHNSAWQQAVMGSFKNNQRVGAWVDTSNPDKPLVVLSNLTKYIRQYSLYIKMGAVRIAAESKGAHINPVAFINPDGSFVVVMKVKNQVKKISLKGLPAGTYGVMYIVSPQESNRFLPDIVLKNNQTLVTSLPEAGIITVYGKRSGSAK